MKTQRSKINDKKENSEEEKIKKGSIIECLKKKYKKHNNLVKGAIILIFGIILGTILEANISPILAPIFPPIDDEPPTIIEVNPLPNSNLFNLSNISVKIEDRGGSGLELESSFIKLSGAYSGEINGTKISKDNSLIFKPIEKLKPDMYTAEFLIRDRAGNLKKDFARFTLFEKPKLRFDFYEMPNEFSENCDVSGIKWKERYIPYVFGIINEGDTLTLKDIEVTFNLPGVVLDYIVESASCVNCNVKEGQSNPLIVCCGKDSETEINFSTCQLVIDIERLPPGGRFGGTIFIDPQYTPKFNEAIKFCDDILVRGYGNCSQLTVSTWLKHTGGTKYTYRGNYFYEQLGWVHKGSIEGEIKMSPDAWINKGIFLRNMGIEYNFPPTLDVQASLNAFDNAIKIDENSSVAWNEKGISLAYLGNFSGAIQSFNKSIDINSNFEDPDYYIGLIYFKLKNCDISTRYAKKALEINPDYETAKELIRLCERQEVVAPEKIKNSLRDISENEGTITFTVSESNLFNKSLEEVIIFDFPIGGSRFILKRDMDFNLVFEHISIQTGIRIAKINLSEFRKCDKVFITLTWSKKENTLYLGCVDRKDKEFVTVKATQIDINNPLIKNFLELQPFLQINNPK